MNWSEVADRMLEKDVMFPILAGTGVFIIVIVRIVAGVFRSSSRERTRREIAAYIAEGSMSPEQGERLMKAGANDSSCG